MTSKSNRRTKLKPIPAFKNEEQEREFWDSHDTTEYFDVSSARRASLPSLRPTTTAISIRLPDSLLAELKSLANARGVPYQSLMKMYLFDRVAAESAPTAARKRKAG